MFKQNKWVTQNDHTIYQILSGRCNCYLLSNGKQAILVDTGVRSEWKKLYRAIMQICGQDISLEAVILTHTHFDHASNAQKLKEIFQTRVIVQQEEAAFLEKGISPIPSGTMLFTKTLVRLAGDRDLFFAKFMPCTGALVFDAYYDLEELGFNAYIIHTPGHSAGSSCVIINDEIALVGDTMVGIIAGIIFPPFADRSDLVLKSWEKLLATGCQVFLPAHGSSNNRDSLEKHYKIYAKRLETEDSNKPNLDIQ